MKSNLRELNFFSRTLIMLIRVYQYVFSPVLGRHCRFHPSCSHYVCKCLQSFPIHRALWYSFQRLMKCHPLHSGGFDPVPQEGNENKSKSV